MPHGPCLSPSTQHRSQPPRGSQCLGSRSDRRWFSSCRGSAREDGVCKDTALHCAPRGPAGVPGPCAMGQAWGALSKQGDPAPPGAWGLEV